MGKINIDKIDREKLAAEKAKILSRKKELDETLVLIREKERAITMREETTMGMSFWRFFKIQYAEAYERIIKSPEFDAYLTTPYPRKIFGLAPLTNDGENMDESDGRVYLDVPYELREIAKKYNAKWDGTAKKWYAPSGVDPAVILAAITDEKINDTAGANQSQNNPDVV